MFLEELIMKPGLTSTPIECLHNHTNFFHELTRVVGKKSRKGSMGPNNYTSGPMLCSSSVVPRFMKSVLISAQMECFLGHANVFHELTSVVGT